MKELGEDYPNEVITEAFVAQLLPVLSSATVDAAVRKLTVDRLYDASYVICIQR